MVLLCGLKTDLRSDPAILNRLYSKSLVPITKKMGKALAKQCNCAAYVECSSKKSSNVRFSMETAIIAGSRFCSSVKRAKYVPSATAAPYALAIAEYNAQHNITQSERISSPGGNNKQQCVMQ